MNWIMVVIFIFGNEPEIMYSKEFESSFACYDERDKIIEWQIGRPIEDYQIVCITNPKGNRWVR